MMKNRKKNNKYQTDEKISQSIMETKEEKFELLTIRLRISIACQVAK